MNIQDLNELKISLQNLLKKEMPQSVRECIYLTIDKISDEQNFLLVPKEK